MQQPGRHPRPSAGRSLPPCAPETQTRMSSAMTQETPSRSPGSSGPLDGCAGLCAPNTVPGGWQSALTGLPRAAANPASVTGRFIKRPPRRGAGLLPCPPGSPLPGPARRAMTPAACSVGPASVARACPRTHPGWRAGR